MDLAQDALANLRGTKRMRVFAFKQIMPRLVEHDDVTSYEGR